ncbi:hypothetical protein CRENBAI_022230 [Crenichthys baileyi]|uniref:Uncharacterized protein n=1 Tax=Crenichthys baileyi TaxID=28760 RepID=A0AAV9QZ69_9TELE
MGCSHVKKVVAFQKQTGRQRQGGQSGGDHCKAGVSEGGVTSMHGFGAVWSQDAAVLPHASCDGQSGLIPHGFGERQLWGVVGDAVPGCLPLAGDFLPVSGAGCFGGCRLTLGGCLPEPGPQGSVGPQLGE